MPRKYKSGAVKFRVMKYDEKQICKAIKSIRKGEMSINKAAKVYNIKRSTLQNKIKNKHMKKQGGQCALTQDEENCFVNMLITTGNWGFPFTKVDLRHITKRFLDNRKTKVSAFKDNFPGEDWAAAFLKRYEKRISERTTQNITPSKAALSVETINAYFDNLDKTLEGVPPQNIANYDETNFTDDPGSKKAIFRRGIKYPESIMAHSKTSTSVMFCGTATGTILPLYIVYRAKYVYQTWVENGPPGARYNATPSGWFDGFVFTDWFKTVYLPFARKLTGPKVLIGDNLSSHFSEEVLQLAAKEDIRFVCLPPNSTHVAQPLDVCFFGPLKRVWRKILTDYKLKHPSAKAVPKDQFPSLMKKVWDHFHRIDNRGKHNLKSGFRTCGIFPCDRRPVLRKVDKTVTTEDNVAALSEAVLSYMKELRHPEQSTTKKGRKRKVTTAPGLSISADDLSQPTVAAPKKPRQKKSTTAVNIPVERQQKKPVKRIQKKSAKKIQDIVTDSDTSETTDDEEHSVASNINIAAQTSVVVSPDNSSCGDDKSSKTMKSGVSSQSFICPVQEEQPKSSVEQIFGPNKKIVAIVDSNKERKSSRIMPSSFETKILNGRASGSQTLAGRASGQSIERPRRNCAVKRM